jgi:hypothetical protein
MTPPNPPSPLLLPTGVRVAATLCWLVGAFTIVAAVVIAMPALTTGVGVLFILVNGGAGVLACVAGVQIRRQRKLGVLVMLVAWAIPTVVALIQHLPVRGSLLLFVALLFAAANWKHLR